MRTLPLSRLALVAAVVGVLAWSALSMLEGRGGVPVRVPWTAPAGMLVIAAAVVAAGWPVRRWTRGDRSRRLDGLRAARALVLARASAYSGAALAGLYLAQVVLAAPDLDVEARRERFFVAVAAVLASLVMVVAGLVVERWCKLPPPDEEDGQSETRLGGAP